MKHPDMQCDHQNLLYERLSLICSDCKKSGLEQYLKDIDFPASFTEVYVNSDTGFSIIKINNHIDMVTFFRSFDHNAECLGTFHDIQEVLQAVAPSLI